MTLAIVLLSLMLGTAAGASEAGSSPAQHFDCHSVTITWNDDWKDWCCKHEGLGCPTTTPLPYYWMGPYQTDIPGIGLGGITVMSLAECEHRCYISPLCHAIQYSNLEKYQGSNCFQFASNVDTGMQYRTFQIFKLFRHTSTLTSTTSTTTSSTHSTTSITSGTTTSRTSFTTTTTETASTQTTMTSTLTTLGCNANCTAGAPTKPAGTCSDRISWTMQHDVELLESANKWPADVFQAKLCKAAGQIVQTECPHCETCDTGDWCSQLTTVTTTPMLGCHTDCMVGVSHGTCEQRIRWAMVHDTQVAMSKHSCKAAHQKILDKCPNCNVCDSKSFCAKEDAANSFFKKFATEDVRSRALFGPKGLSKLVSVSLIMVTVVAGTIFALVAYRRSSRIVSVHYEESYADPLCPMTDEQLSEAA